MNERLRIILFVLGVLFWVTFIFFRVYDKKSFMMFWPIGLGLIILSRLIGVGSKKNKD
jgi:hypothetical protein